MRRLLLQLPVLSLALAIPLGGCDKSKSAKPGEGSEERIPAPPHKPSGTNASDAMTLHFINVGQGDATLIEFPCGVVVIDTGGELNEGFDGERAYRDYLTKFFDEHPERQRAIDLLVITHPHIDHTRSIEWTLENFEVRNVLHNGQYVEDDIGSPPQKAMVDWAAAHPEVGAKVITAESVPGNQGLTDAIIDPVGSCEAGGVDPKITALWGWVDDHDKTYGQNPNDHSVVLRVDYGQSSALFTGDLQMMGLARMAKRFEDKPELLDVDIYQVGHHGSHNATKPYFVQLMSPELAVISMGAYDRDLDWTARRYGHPHHKAIDPLLDRKSGVRRFRESAKEVMLGLRGAWKETPSEFEARTVRRAVYGTGWDGTIVASANANGWIEVRTEN